MMQTVREQLVEALEAMNDMFGCCAICGDAPHNCELDHKDQLVQRQAYLALDRARAKPCTDACLHHKDDDLPDCPCYEAGLGATPAP